MTAQIRPNRMEVSDRFPMLGFAVHSDEADINAEVVLATEIGLFQQQNRARRTAANFYSSREHGMLQVPRGEGVFVVPPEVLARFIGNDRLYFGLATGKKSNGGLHVDAVPRDGSPYVSLRGFTGRTLRRSMGRDRQTTPPMLDWTGDIAQPGSQPAPNGNGSNGAKGNGSSGAGSSAPATPSAPAAAAQGRSMAYDDGFGDMPDLPARNPAPGYVPPLLPNDPRERARRIGGLFPDRICQALDLGLQPQSIDPLLSTLEGQRAPSPMGYYARAKDDGDDQIQMPAAPGPRARAMDGGAGAAIAVATFVIETISNSKGDVSWDLDQLRGIKHPNDKVPANPGPFQDGATIKLDDWPVSGGLVDDISAWFKIDWQYNGQSLGNVRITNIGTNDAVGWGLTVRAQIMDDNKVYAPNNCAALRLTFHYRFDRSIGSDVIAIRNVTLYGDGTWESNGNWVQSSTFAAAKGTQRRGYARAKDDGDSDDQIQMPAAPGPRARAMDGGVGAAIAVATFVISTISNSKGDVSWDLDQLRGIKHPNDVAPTNPGPFRDGATINLDDWPVSGGLVDDISAWFKIDWQYNGQSLGNVRVTNIGTNDAVGWGLTVRAQIMDDNKIYAPNNCAALRLTFHYRFDRSIGSDVIAIRNVTLYGDGTWESNGNWVQSSTFAAAKSAQRGGYARAKDDGDSDDQIQMPAAPGPRARAMDGGVGAAIAVATFVISTISNSKGDVSWDLDQLRGIKHPNDVAPANPGPFRDGATINLDDWPVSGGLVDDISAWFKIDWQYNGQSLGNVRVTNIGTNDAVGWGLSVRGQIMDDNKVYAPNNCAALRLTFHYRFDRSIGSDVIAIRNVTLYGDGTWESNGNWVQSSTFAAAKSAQRGGYARAKDDGDSDDQIQMPAAPGPRARAMEGKESGAGNAISVAKLAIETISNSQGDVNWQLDQMRGIKHPNDKAPANAGAFRDGATINLDDWPVSGGLVDDISAWFKIDWQYNGQSLGNVRITNIGTNDAVGWGLTVRAQIMDDNRVYAPNNCAALRLTFHYRFDRTIGSDVIAIRNVTLYGDGTWESNGDWVQSSTFAAAKATSRKRPGQRNQGQRAYA